MMAGSMLRPLSSCGASRVRPAAVHLVMCPFAGGSSAAFRSWQTLDASVLDVALDISLVVYPGRDQRMQEACASSIAQLADELAAALMAETADRADRCRPLAPSLILAGHSMGAQLAFETCLRLERSARAPRALVLSGCHAPHLRPRRRLSGLDDFAFAGQLQQIGGSAAGALDLRHQPDLLAAFLPMLRADFMATENYDCQLESDPRRVSTPLLLICGGADQEASPDEVRAWEAWHARPGEVAFTCISGDHFYPTRHPHDFIAQILRYTAPTLCK